MKTWSEILKFQAVGGLGFSSTPPRCFTESKIRSLCTSFSHGCDTSRSCLEPGASWLLHKLITFQSHLYVSSRNSCNFRASEQPFSQITATYRAVPPAVLKLAHGGGLLTVSQTNDGGKHELRSGLGFVSARRVM